MAESLWSKSQTNRCRKCDFRSHTRCDVACWQKVKLLDHEESPEHPAPEDGRSVRLVPRRFFPNNHRSFPEYQAGLH